MNERNVSFIYTRKHVWRVEERKERKEKVDLHMSRILLESMDRLDINLKINQNVSLECAM